MKRFKDQPNREVFLKKEPKRIISLAPSQTELLVDLGLSDCIVGITKFCVHPKRLKKEKAIVGGTKGIKIEKIQALSPDIILCNKEENSIEIIEALKNVAPIHISNINTLKYAYKLIIAYGEIFSVESRAKDIILGIKSERKFFRSKLENSCRLQVAYVIWKDPWMVAASNTFINSMLLEAGFDNVFKDECRYPEISLEHPKLKTTDIIFLSTEPYPFKDKHIKFLKTLFPKKPVVIVDGEMFSWYGSRLLKSFKYYQSLYL